MTKNPPSKPQQTEDLELEPDAWERFEASVDKAVRPKGPAKPEPVKPERDA